MNKSDVDLLTNAIESVARTQAVLNGAELTNAVSGNSIGAEKLTVRARENLADTISHVFKAST
jgi:hypothetical protein